MRELPFVDERLALIASLVRKGSVVADIGSDHGFLVTWLVKSGICPSGFACDVNEMPLERSRHTVESYGVSDRVALRLGSGLVPLRQDEAQDIVIAGMGGDLIADILSAADWRDESKHYLLQPMTRADELRRRLCAQGYEITAEHAASVNRFCYTVMEARYTGQASACTELFALVGKMPQCRTAQGKRYIRRQAQMVQKKIEGLSRSANRADEQAPLKRLYAEILKTIEEEHN